MPSRNLGDWLKAGREAIPSLLRVETWWLIFWTRRGEMVWFQILTGRRMKAGEWRIWGFSQDLGSTF